MPKYLLIASYTAEGAKGVLKEGGTSRKKQATAAVKAAGGKVDAFYFAFGPDDAYVLIDVPDHASAAAVSLTVSSSGAVRCRTLPLITPEEIDEASKKSIAYRPPGS